MNRAVKYFIKSLYAKILTTFVYTLGKKKAADKAIFIFSIPRAGSTWFMNLIQNLPGTVALFEPLFPKENPFVEPFLVDQRFYNNDRLLKFNFKGLCQQLILGKKITRWSSNHSKKIKYFTSQRVVVKFLRANFLLKWFNNHFPTNKKIVLLRHPGAVVASMLRSPGGWHKPSKERFMFISNQIYGDRYAAVINQCRENFEFMCIYYCLEVKALLQDFQPAYNNYLISYEDLVENKKEVFISLEAFLGEQLTSQFYASLKKISKTTNSNSSLNSKRPIENWMNELSDYQKTRMSELLTEFGIEIYTMDSLYPDENKIILLNKPDQKKVIPLRFI